MVTRAKIFWSEVEKQDLACKIDELMYVVKGYTYLSAVLKAQELVLPPERHRKILFWAHVRDALLPFLQKAKAAREGASYSPETEPGHAQTPPVAPPSTTELLAKVLVDVFVQALSSPQVQSAVQSLVLQGLAAAQSGAVPAADEVAAPKSKLPEAPLKKVLVAGLLPSQAEEIKKSCGALCDLRFWRSDESKEHLRHIVKHVDITIGVTNFLPHSAEALLKASAPPYIRHPGGVKTLKATIAEALASAGRA